MHPTCIVVELAIRLMSGGIRKLDSSVGRSVGDNFCQLIGEPNVPMYRPDSVQMRTEWSVLELRTRKEFLETI